jgi:hypothetical protein
VQHPFSSPQSETAGPEARWKSTRHIRGIRHAANHHLGARCAEPARALIVAPDQCANLQATLTKQFHDGAANRSNLAGRPGD